MVLDPPHIAGPEGWDLVHRDWGARQGESRASRALARWLIARVAVVHAWAGRLVARRRDQPAGRRWT